ncbi:MAG: RpiB/LacA/LacB family sugar-phosphate isomerase, partial [Microgenomates group bacterium]
MTDLHKKSVFNRIFIGADHRGFELKEHIKDWLQEYELTVVDCGAHAYEVSDDYPDFAFLVAQNVMKTQGSCGIVICGSGVGVSIVANKIDGVRSVLG